MTLEEQGAPYIELSEGERAALYLNAIVNSSDDAIIGKDLNGIVQSWNGGAERIFGYPAAEAIGKSIRMIIPPERQSEEDQVLSTIRAGERVDHFETKRMRKDGSIVEISLTVSPIKDSTGRIIGASKVARDISERKKAERLKDQFLSLVSHEIRTPLATIYGDSRILRASFDSLTNGDRVDLLDDLVRESDRLQRVIENLLLLTRLEAKGIQFEVVGMANLLGTWVGAFRERYPEAKVELMIDPDFPPVLGNCTYLELVIENLLSNAVKYSPEDAQIEIVARSETVPSVSVLDRGIGFTPSEAGQLFTPFHRTEQASQMASGMGLGLAVCKRVIEAQGGSIWASPRSGGGAEFGFSLPEPKTDGGLG